MMLGGLYTTQTLTFSSLESCAGRAHRDRTSKHARMSEGPDPRTLCLQGGDAYKMDGRSSSIHSVAHCLTPCGTAWASRDRRPSRARMPGAPDLFANEPLQAHRASYFTRSKPKSSVNSSSTSIPLSLLR